MEQLIEGGAKFEHYDGAGGITTNAKGIAEDGPRKMAWFTDPAGNIHGLLQGPG